MYSHMWRDMRDFVRPYGFRFRRSSVGFSVASAREANVSMIRLTHSIWMALRGLSVMVKAEMMVSVTATMLTVSWNWRNFEMES